jgi:pilus assembly protein Flp/PilA
MNMRKQLLAFLRDEEGLTMVEYAIAGSLVAGGCVAAFTGLGTAITAKIDWLAGKVNP